MLLIGRDIADVLGRVSGQMSRGQNKSAEFKRVTILDRLDGKTVLRATFAARVNLRRLCAIRQFS